MARRRSKSHPATNQAQIAFVLSLFLLFLLIAGGIGRTIYLRMREMAANSNFPLFPAINLNDDDPTTWNPVEEPLPVWTGTERVNVLVLGIDERGNEEGPWRTDTMMVFTVDPLARTAGILSIPRDLWVPFPIPEYGYDRINTANFIGDAYDYPGGGPALARDTVEYNLGVPIHYYARVNFDGFIELVDLIGGIDIYVEETIDDPAYPSSDPRDPYGVEHLYIEAGMQHMDGALALKYARTRHGGTDFDRAQRQQQVLMAIFDKITRLDMLPQLAPQAQQIWQTLSDSIQTDLSLEEVAALANLAAQIDSNDIRQAVIDANYTLPYETPDGQQVLVPVRERIRELRNYIFTSEVQVAEGQDPAIRLAEESATVEVQNGTLSPGLAQSIYEFLLGQGISVTGYSNADRNDYDESLVIVYTGKTFTAEYIAQLLTLPPTAVVHAPDPEVGIDIVVILGADYQAETP
ncbi:MAG: LCP family protein [Anaerolineae bacterium]|nr:LCP family protein [Anaerolineae bacterium]